MEASCDELEAIHPLVPGLCLGISGLRFSRFISEAKPPGCIPRQSLETRVRTTGPVASVLGKGGISQAGGDILPAAIAHGADGFFEAQILRIQSATYDHARNSLNF